MILSSGSPHHFINAQLLKCGQRVNEPGVIARAPGNQHKYCGYLRKERSGYATRLAAVGQLVEKL